MQVEKGGRDVGQMQDQGANPSGIQYIGSESRLEITTAETIIMTAERGDHAKSTFICVKGVKFEVETPVCRFASLGSAVDLVGFTYRVEG